MAAWMAGSEAGHDRGVLEVVLNWFSPH